jgi:hypothetical protein
MAAVTHSILELAKQGDGQAIATLINRSIQSKGITATADLGEQCLSIDLRSPQKINQKAMVALICKGMLGLQVQAINELIISAYLSDYETASDHQIWQVNLKLDTSQPPLRYVEVSPTQSSTSPQLETTASLAKDLYPEIQSETSTEIDLPINPQSKVEIKPEIILENTNLAVTIPVHQPVEIVHIPPAYQDIIIRFIDAQYGNIKCLCTLTELVEAINTFSFDHVNPALQHLLEAIADSTTLEENGDRLINNISVLQPGSQWQKAKIRLVLTIFFESAEYAPNVITLEATEAIASGNPTIPTPKNLASDKPENEVSKTPKEILLEDLSSLLTDLQTSKSTPSLGEQESTESITAEPPQ